MTQPGPERYPTSAVTLHWVIAILIFVLLGIGWYMVDIPRGTPARGEYFNLHKSLGLIVMLLIALLLLWRSRNRPPPLPDFLPRWEARAAIFSHWLLYLCLVVVPLSGYLESNFTKWGIDFFGLHLPAWGPDDETLYTIFNRIHVISSNVFAVLIALHMAAAIKHAMVRDGILSRMLPDMQKRSWQSTATD
jgi:cytochrome b561